MRIDRQQTEGLGLAVRPWSTAELDGRAHDGALRPDGRTWVTLSAALHGVGSAACGPEPLPEYAVFSIGAPKPFRIVSITQDKDEPDQIEITAIEVNRLKWAFVDGTVELRDLVALQTGPLSRYVYPVTGAQIVP